MIDPYVAAFNKAATELHNHLKFLVGKQISYKINGKVVIGKLLDAGYDDYHKIQVENSNNGKQYWILKRNFLWEMKED